MTGRAAASVVILIACLGLALLIFAEVTGSTGELASASAGPASPAARGGDTDLQDTAYSLPPLQKFSEVTARPLFSQGRRPPLVAGQSADGPISSWVLHGVIISRGVRAALLEHGKPLTFSSVAVGQEIDGWTVVEIASDEVVLRSGARQEALRLYAESDGQPSAGAPNPGTAAPRGR